MSTQYNKGVCSIHLGEELNAAVEAECAKLGLAKSKVVRYLLKKWLAGNARSREVTGGGSLNLGKGGW